MKHLRASALFSLFLCSAFAIGQVQYTPVYDCHSNAYLIGASPFATYKEPFGIKNLELPVMAFTGTNNIGGIVGGFKAGFSFPLAKSAEGSRVPFVGVDFAWLNEQGHKPRFAVFGSLRF